MIDGRQLFSYYLTIQTMIKLQSMFPEILGSSKKVIKRVKTNMDEIPISLHFNSYHISLNNSQNIKANYKNLLLPEALP